MEKARKEHKSCFLDAHLKWVGHSILHFSKLPIKVDTVAKTSHIVLNSEKTWICIGSCFLDLMLNKCSSTSEQLQKPWEIRIGQTATEQWKTSEFSGGGAGPFWDKNWMPWVPAPSKLYLGQGMETTAQFRFRLADSSISGRKVLTPGGRKP